MERSKRILVVDDEETLCDADALAFNLEAEGYEVATAYSAEQALTYDLSAFDLVMLDIMMGEISGIQLAGIMKSKPDTAMVPIIFCTAKDTEEDMIKGLDLGADDYIMKPYSLKAVLARVRAVLRRTAAHAAARPADEEQVAYRGLVLSRRNRTCHVDGREVKMPKKEFEILLKLVANIGQVFSREQLLREIWPDEVVVLDRVVDVNITRIRRKIGEHVQATAMGSSNRLTYPQRLFLWLLGYSILLVGSFIAFQYQREKQFKAEEMNTRLQMINTYILTKLSEGTPIADISLKDFHPFNDIRISVIAKDGTVVYDNSTDSLPGENHLQREEIREALAHGSGYIVRRHSTSTGGYYFYSATKGSDGRIVRTAVRA